jgi:hypothetical protein
MGRAIDHKQHDLLAMRTTIAAIIGLQRKRSALEPANTDHLVEMVLLIAGQAAQRASVDLSHVIQKLEIWDLIAETEDEMGRVEHAIVQSVRRDLEKLRQAETRDGSSRQSAGGDTSSSETASLNT